MNETVLLNSITSTTGGHTGFWRHDNGTIWNNDVPCPAYDGKRLHYAVISYLKSVALHLDAGLLDGASLLLHGRKIVLFNLLNNEEYNNNLANAKTRLMEARAYEATNGTGSAYVPNHPFAQAARRSEGLKYRRDYARPED